MSRADPLAELLRHCLAEARCGWSIGSHGVIAEFLRAAEEPVRLERGPRRGLLETPRGALRIELPAATRAFAWETPSAGGLTWHHALALCLPARAARLTARARLAELGADRQAVREPDRGAVLFDLGLQTPYLTPCVRTADAALLAALRGRLGRPLLAARQQPLLELLRAASPHRVFLSRLGRIEVYAPIAAAAPGARTPQGPHTHLLPELLAERRHHPPGAPLPEGLVAAVTLYPPAALQPVPGKREPRLDAAAHAAFQQLLERWGDPQQRAEKRRVRAAVLAGGDPAAHPAPADARLRAARRVALRELRHSHPRAPALAGWLAAFDGPEPPAARGAARAD